MHAVVGRNFRVWAAGVACLAIALTLIQSKADNALAGKVQVRDDLGACIKLDAKIAWLKQRKKRTSTQFKRRLTKEILRLKRRFKARCDTEAVMSDGSLASSHSVLAASLQREIAKTKKDFVFSPYSVHTALSMLYAGARKKTAAEIAAALGLDKGSASKLPELQLELNQALFSLANGVELRNANMVYLDERLKPNPTFLNTLRTNYLADAELANFHSDPEGMRQRINGKVDELTNQMIKDLFPPGSITADTRLSLVNAVYMNSEWQYQFDAAREGVFHAPGGDIKAMMMFRKSSFGYRSNSGYETIELPYTGGTTSMYIILPNAGSEGWFTKKLSPGLLEEATSGLSKAYLPLRMPKFTIDTALNQDGNSLKELLIKLGVRDAFSQRADFSGIARNIFIGTAVHKAKIKVDEKGTEAAAATGIGMMTISAPEIVSVDRPFLFLVKHNPSGAILFQGFVSNPKP